MKRLIFHALFFMLFPCFIHAANESLSIQAALDSNPGQMVFVPEGDHVLSAPLAITHHGSGLYGPGRIIQSDADSPILIIRNANDVRVSGLTFARLKGKENTSAPGIEARDCRYLSLERARVLDNRSPAGSINLENCDQSEIVHCLVRDYMTLSIDDRTDSADWGYAFHCIDGTGIVVRSSSGVLIEGNRVIETTLRPTEELQQRHRLGEFAKKNASKGAIVSQEIWDAEYVNNWHQGSGIIVTSPDASDHTRIIGNHVENAAQGIDIHADHVIVQGNVVVNSFMGMKAMHGSRNVLIIGNQFSKNDLWSIGLMPGASSRAASEIHSENVDGGSIIADNIISDFGRGDSQWIWKTHRRMPILLDHGQKPENPPLSDVVISGNVVYDTGGAGSIGSASKPNYEYAVYISDGEWLPKRLRFSNNLFHPGRRGISNLDLHPYQK